MPNINKKSDPLAAQIKPGDVHPTVRTPDGAVDPVETALNELRASGGVIESNEVLESVSAEEYIEILHKQILAHRREWTKENERADGLKTHVMILWVFVAFLIFAIVILKVSK
jgi:uncharacterized protein YhaN